MNLNKRQILTYILSYLSIVAVIGLLLMVQELSIEVKEKKLQINEYARYSLELYFVGEYWKSNSMHFKSNWLAVTEAWADCERDSLKLFLELNKRDLRNFNQK